LLLLPTEVCSKIERREREIALMLDEMDREAATDELIMPETVQRLQQACPASPEQAASPSQRNKRGNVFQRLLRSLRRRFARQQQQTTPEQQRQHQQVLQRRQRTL